MIDYSELRHLLVMIGTSMARFIAFFSVLPFLGGDILPGYAKNAVIMALVIMVVPVVAGGAPDPLPPTFSMLLLLSKEVLVGIVMGFVSGMIFWTAQVVGFLIDNQRGATMASVLDPLYGESTSPLGSLLQQAVTTLFFAGGGFLLLLQGLFESYLLWPVFQFYPGMEGGVPLLFFLHQVDKLMKTAFLLASPVIIVLLLTELCLGLISRFAPQMNVFSLSMPIKSGAANFLLVIYMTTLLYYFRDCFLELSHLVDILSAVLQ